MKPIRPAYEESETLLEHKMSGSEDPALTTGQVSELLHVHPSTVKRWFGEESASVTAGGHRRIPLAQILRVARERGQPTYLDDFGADATSVWLSTEALSGGDAAPLRLLMYAWLKEGRSHLIGRLLAHLGLRDGGPSPELLDGAFGGFMRHIGDAWAQGYLRVGEERAASREVVEALHAIIDRRGGRSAGLDPARPTAVVGSTEGDQHFIGPLLVRATLLRNGWNVEYLGGDVPIPEFVTTQQRTRSSLVCVSFTPPLGAADVRRFIAVVTELVDPARAFALAIGGSGAAGFDVADVSGRLTAIVGMQTLVELDAWVHSAFPSHDRGDPHG